MSVVRNEQTKYTATFLNTLAAGMILAGAIAPAVALIYGNQALTSSGLVIVGAMFVWLLSGAILHLTVRRTLKRLV